MNVFSNIFDCITGEKYDIKRNQWEPIKVMKIARSNFAAVVLEGRIYVIGGFDGKIILNPLKTQCGKCKLVFFPGSTTIPYVECYDERVDEWYDITGMNVNRSALSACVVRGLSNAKEYTFLSIEQPRMDTSPTEIATTSL